MNKLLVDTSVIIDFLRQKDKERTSFYKLTDEELYVSVVTHTELYAGTGVWENETALSELEGLFSDVGIVPLTTEISRTAGKLKARYRQISLIDCIIAATAQVEQILLVTLNLKHFQQIKDLKLFSAV